MKQGGPLGHTEQGLSIDAYGNPSYTIKEGGTLKKKPQPYAADKTGRDGLNIDKERILQTTAPGSYNIASEIGKKKDDNEIYKKKSANERLKDIGLFPNNLSLEQ